MLRIKPLGDHFGQELVAAGLNEAIGWHPISGEIFGAESFSEAKLSQLQNLIDAHNKNAKPAVIVARAVTVTAMAELQILGDDIEGLEQAVNIAAAFPVDVNVYWIFLATPEDRYIPFVQAPGFNADVTLREPDFFEVTITDRATNGPAIPSSLSITVQKVG